MAFTIRFLVAVIAGFSWISCSSDSEDTQSINDLYRISDQYRARLMDAGCEVSRFGNMGGKADIRCADETDLSKLGERAQLLTEWGEFLDQVIHHPHLPGLSQKSYKSLQILLLDRAEALQTYIFNEGSSRRDLETQVTTEYEQWVAAVAENADKLSAMGCYFFSETIKDEAGAGESPCDEFLYALEKLEIHQALTDLVVRGTSLFSKSATFSFHNEVNRLYQETVKATKALFSHMIQQQELARVASQTIRARLKSDYGLEFQLIYSENPEFPPIVINLPEDKRTQEDVDDMVLKVREYVQVAQFYLDYEVLGSSSTGTASSERRRLEVAKAFLQGPLDLDYIRTHFEPKPMSPQPQENIPETAPEHGSNMVARNFNVY